MKKIRPLNAVDDGPHKNVLVRWQRLHTRRAAAWLAKFVSRYGTAPIETARHVVGKLHALASRM